MDATEQPSHSDIEKSARKLGVRLSDDRQEQRVEEYAGAVKALEIIAMLCAVSLKSGWNFSKAKGEIETFLVNDPHFRASFELGSKNYHWTEEQLDEISIATREKVKDVLSYFENTHVFSFVNLDGNLNHAEASRLLRNINVRW